MAKGRAGSDMEGGHKERSKGQLCMVLGLQQNNVCSVFGRLAKRPSGDMQGWRCDLDRHNVYPFNPRPCIKYSKLYIRTLS